MEHVDKTPHVPFPAHMEAVLRLQAFELYWRRKLTSSSVPGTLVWVAVAHNNRAIVAVESVSLVRDARTGEDYAVPTRWSVVGSDGRITRYDSADEALQAVLESGGVQ